MNCKVCGNVIEEGAVFCAACGASTVEAADTVSENVGADSAMNVTADLSQVAEALEKVAEQTGDMPDEMVKSEEEKLNDMMEKADRIIEEQPKEPDFVKKPDESQIITAVISESHGEKKVKIKTENKRRYNIAVNPVAVTVFNVLLSVVFTGVLFMAVSIFMLADKNFDGFYSSVVFADIVANIDFWVLTCSWYAMAMYAILVLLAVIMFLVLKRRKYAILNYIGIPAIVDGAVFLFIVHFSNWISKAFSFSGLAEELFDVIGGIANEQIMFGALCILGTGIAAVLVYVITAVIHKAVYRRRCRKAEKT